MNLKTMLKGSTDASMKYKVKPYDDSDKEPLGLTIKGKALDYKKAHNKIKSSLVKGKVVKTTVGEANVIDVVVGKAMTLALVEVVNDKDETGSVELKAYEQSLNKKKPVTLELRKTSDCDFSFVEKLKDLLVFGPNVWLSFGPKK